MSAFHSYNPLPVTLSLKWFRAHLAKKCSHLTGVRPKREISGSDKPKNLATAGRHRKYKKNKETDRRRRKKRNGHIALLVEKKQLESFFTLNYSFAQMLTETIILIEGLIALPPYVNCFLLKTASIFECDLSSFKEHSPIFFHLICTKESEQ